MTLISQTVGHSMCQPLELKKEQLFMTGKKQPKSQISYDRNEGPYFMYSLPQKHTDI